MARADYTPAKIIGRRFRAPWTVEELDAAFVVRDGNGRPLTYVYYEDQQGPRSPAKPLSRDEARQIATDVAKLPKLLRQRFDSRLTSLSGSFTVSNFRHAAEVAVLALLGMLCGATFVIAVFGH